MNTVLSLKSDEKTTEMIALVKSAIDSEIARLELALQMANERLMPFEKKYKVSSSTFMQSWAAEDLEDGDDEYISWAGEVSLKNRLLSKLECLRGIVYDASGIH